MDRRTNLKARLVLAILVLGLTCNVLAAIELYRWDDGADPNESWNAASNWNPDGISRNVDMAEINMGGGVNCLIDSSVDAECYYLEIGIDTGSNELTMTGGTLSTGHHLSIGLSGMMGSSEGIFTMSGGTVDVGEMLRIGYGENTGFVDYAFGMLALSGGEVNVEEGVQLGQNASGIGYLAISDGTLNIDGASSDLELGAYGTAEIDMAGGDIYIEDDLILGGGTPGGTATIIMDGGIINCGDDLVLVNGTPYIYLADGLLNCGWLYIMPEESALINITEGELRIRDTNALETIQGYVYEEKIVGYGGEGVVDVTESGGNLHVTARLPRIYVDANATGLNDGTSWTNAYNYLKEGLTSASPCDSIWVAEGTYYPDRDFNTPGGSGDRTATFQLIDGVAIYGGFPSGGGPWTSRNPSLYQTILSGDLNGNDVYVNDPCDLLTEPTRTENSYHVITGSGTDANTILDGFTITAGNANTGEWPDSHGGGMFSDYTNCMVNECTFVENSSGHGGAMWSGHSDLHISNCTFLRNAAGQYGGGMNNYHSSPEVTNCTFNENAAIEGGGGVFNTESSNPTLLNCRFTSNKGLGSGNNAGGLYNVGSSPQVINCVFINNSAHWGGAVSNINGSSPPITNCTFKDNWATGGCGGINDYNGCNPVIMNCILWGNTAPQMSDYLNCESSVSFCDIQGEGSGLGNIDEDPLFWDAKGHLLSNSPCRNAGCGGDYSGQTDMDGQPRVMEDTVDIGADETLPPIQNIDTNEVYATIQDAIDDAYDGETIVVQPGTYTGTGNTGIDFMGKAITLRSAEPNGPNVVAATIIDCNNEEESFGVAFIQDEDANSVLNGFTITNANSGMAGNGGAIYCFQSTPKVKNCILRNNISVVGGGIYCRWYSYPIIENCIIKDNTATAGGGILCHQSSPTIHGGTIKDNSPDGIYLDADSTFVISGTVHVISNDIVGQGNLQLGSGGSLDLDDAHVFCSMSGTGTMEIALGAKATIDGSAFIDLGDPYDPNIRGTIDCKGMLKVRDNGRITNAKINITKASFEDKARISNSEIHVDSKAPYGQVFAEPNISFVDVNIYADGDRYMDMDPSVFDGNFVNVKIFVTITEGVGKPFGGLFECRGEPNFADVNSCDPNNSFFCQANPGTILNCDVNTWTLERLELIPGAKLNLTNRFPFQSPYDQAIDHNDVVYVKKLILGPNSVLNLSFNRLYYETLEMDPNAVIKNMPLLGFSMINIALDDQTEFIVRVTHNNYTDPNNQNYNRVHIERVTGQSPDANGMMQMYTLEDEDPCSPTYQQDVNACAKGTFAKTSGDEDAAIEFEYMFTADPCGDAELVVYLSDDPELGQNIWEVARLVPPTPGRPGSIGSDRFAVFSGMFPAEGFYFIRGTYIELRLTGSANASCLINNWDPRVNCIGICGDFNIDVFDVVDIYDYLVLLAEYGLCNPGGAGKGCLDLIGDGHVNNDDILAWGTDELLHACGGGGGGASAARMPASEGQIASETEPLLICGKPLSGSGKEVPSNFLYSVDTGGVCVDADQTNSAGRLVTDSDGIVYQIDSYLGLINLETQAVVVGPDTIVYGGGSVVIGYDNGKGLLLSDAVFKPGDANIVYIVPVQVDPQDGNCPYMAAAKLQLTGGGNYNLLELYGKNPATDPDQQNTITDCNGSLLYEPDVQNLHEIEIDYEGNLYVLSSDWFNENNWLLVYDVNAGNDSEVRLSLASYTNIVGPTAMVVSSSVDMLNLASSVDGPSDLISEVYRFSINKAIPSLSLYRIVGISCPAPGVCSSYQGMCDPELGYVSMITSMTESPVDGTLYVTGFTAPKFPNDATMSSWPYNQAGGIFTTPMLAEVTLGASGTIGAVNISGDLVLPSSLVWTGPLTPEEEKCGGADIYADGIVNLKDFAVLAKYWLETNCGGFGDCEGADLEPLDLPDGDVDIADLAVLCLHWLETGCLD